MALIAACSDSSGEDASSPTPVVVDTDMGVDDVRALMFLVEHPGIEVIAISVTGTGLGRCPESAHNVAAILEALGAAAVPIGCGTNSPLEGFNTFPTELRNAAVELPGMALDPVMTDVPDAVDVLNEALASSETPLTLLTLGPLTNVAKLLDTNPTPSQIEEIRMMGGAIDVGGNIISFENFSAEFNIWIDPIAAQRVLDSGVAVTMIPLDATNDVPLTPGFVAGLEAGPQTVAGEKLLANLVISPEVTGLYHWDDLAAATLVDEGLVSFETVDVAIDTDFDSPTIGQTKRTPNGTPVRVAVAAERDPFERLLFETITGTARTTQNLWEPSAVIRVGDNDCAYEGPDPLPAGLGVRIENATDEPGLGVVFGRYSEDASGDDIQALIDRGFNAPPSFFDIQAVATLPANTTSYANPTGLSADTTIWCAANDDLTELAGPKIRTP